MFFLNSLNKVTIMTPPKVEVVEIETTQFRNSTSVVALQRIHSCDSMYYIVSVFREGKKIFISENLLDLNEAYSIFRHKVLHSKIPLRPRE
jgi:hypothetical protein